MSVLADMEAAAAMPESGEDALSRIIPRLDLGLQLLAGLWAEKHDLLPCEDVQVSLEGASWKSEQPPCPGAEGYVWLTPSRQLPLPLILPARVLSADDGLTCVVWQFTSDVEQDWFSRTLFRYHRRDIQTRKREG
ncbi:PilZ domain-containing protein [Burkholderiaceae bacterium DAT-1]|nr:PilZ domain-containing protein [Burkholderiaceae bacterium DAT-1]